MTSSTSSSGRGHTAELRRPTAVGVSSGTFVGTRTGTVTAPGTERSWKQRSAAAPSPACSPTSTTYLSAGGRVGPRETFERLEHSVKLARVDDQDTWSVVCFYVHPSAKRNGVASALLDAAIARTTAHGAPMLEGYAVREGHMNIDSYTGYLPMFLEAGFEVIRPAGRRTIVRRRLER